MSDTETPPEGDETGGESTASEPTSTSYTIKSPNTEYNGQNSSVTFTNGEGYTDNETLANQFRDRGYTVSEGGTAPGDPPPASVVAPTSGIAALSRDAAVVGSDAAGPLSEAFLAPMGAGEGSDPHSTDVVSPGLHAVPPGPLVPGEVSSDPAEQEQRESTEAGAVLMESEPVDEHSGPDWGGGENEAEPTGPLNLSDPASEGLSGDAAEGTEPEPPEGSDATPTAPTRPAENGTKEAWVEYAVSQGMSREDAEGSTRTALIERYPEGGA